ncbi:uncharacterized protein [Montipora foliosa]|uniref:uncharacterized protein n=1 Tax=Montipora foliosa TaxID=591990 RepID=UPI0035F11296
MLLDAVTRGRIYQVKFLLESGTEDVNRTDEDKHTALMKAIFLPDKMHRTRYKIIKILLEYGARVNIADRDGRTALMWACIRGQEPIARKIIDFSILDVDLNATDRFGNTALFYAASNGQVNAVNQLIKALKRFGLNTDKMNARGMTPILEATKQGHDECAKLLMTEGQASLTTIDPTTLLNAEGWAEKRSLTNLSEMIAARRSPSPQMDVYNIENDPGETVEALPNSANSDKQSDIDQLGTNDIKTADRALLSRRERDPLVDAKFKGRNESFVNPSHGQLNDRASRKEMRKGVIYRKETSVSPRITAITNMSLTRRKCEQGNKTKGPTLTAKSEICRLLGLYGIQHSDSYRQSFDPIILPPSGYWPDPLAHLRDSASSVGDEEIDMNFLELIRPRGSGRRRSSTFPAQGAPEMGRRGSCRDPRRGSTMMLGIPPAMGKRSSITPSPIGNKNFLETPTFSFRKSTLSANSDRRGSTLGAFDRRGSLMPRGSEQNRPTFVRKTISQLAPSLGHIAEG